MIRNIIFDMGNVLVNYDPKEYIEQFAEKQDIDILYKTIFKSTEWIQLDRGCIKEEDAKSIFYSKLPERLHTTVDDIFNNWHENLHGKNEMFFLVKQLKALGYNIYLLSNTSKRFYHYCKKIPALTYFDGTVISADELLLKPDLDIYKRLLHRYKLIAQECFFIDDQTVNVEAAKFLGMDGFVYENNIIKLRRELSHKGILDKNVQAIIFDLDKVLTSTEKICNQLTQKIDNLSKKDLPFDIKELLSQLKTNGILIAASCSKNTYTTLKKTTLLPFVDIVVNENDIEPVVDKLGVPYESCITID